MKYADINKQFWDRNEKVLLFEQKLVKAASDIRQALEDLLDPPFLTWTDPNGEGPHRYIDVRATHADRGWPTVKSINSAGELHCSLVVTLDQTPNTGRKHELACPVAIRFNQRHLEYAFYNPKDDQIDGAWHSDINVFCQAIANRIGEFAEHDPEDGFDNRRSIGFLVGT